MSAELGFDAALMADQAVSRGDDDKGGDADDVVVDDEDKDGTGEDGDN